MIARMASASRERIVIISTHACRLRRPLIRTVYDRGEINRSVRNVSTMQNRAADGNMAVRPSPNQTAGVVGLNVWISSRTTRTAALVATYVLLAGPAAILPAKIWQMIRRIAARAV